MMHVLLDGEQRIIEDGLTIAQFLDEADPAYRHGLVEVNGELLPATCYSHLLAEGDRIEVILPAFGG